MSGREDAMKAWGLLAATMIVVVAWTCVKVGARAQSPSYSGRMDYETYCSSCHGAAALGDGPFAKSLKKRPADLTQLAKANNGVFPDEKVFKTIDGSQPHTDSAMPKWGEVFAKSRESEGAQNAAARMRVLVEYLRTLQAKP
jgi:mono/diheme cytochrome c family protein